MVGLRIPELTIKAGTGIWNSVSSLRGNGKLRLKNPQTLAYRLTSVCCEHQKDPFLNKMNVKNRHLGLDSDLHRGTHTTTTTNNNNNYYYKV